MNAESLKRSLSWRISRQPVLRSLRELSAQADAELWWVGGFIRDVALGHPPGDWDFVVPRGIERLLTAIEQAHGARGFSISKRGVTTWRTRILGQDLDLVDAAEGGLVEDLLRRDLTFNAMAYSPTRDELCDPAGGLRDLRQGLIRAPREGVFDEDPLRALRLARFAGLYRGFRMEPQTVAAARSIVNKLNTVSVERTRYEYDKILKQPQPAVALRYIEDWGILEVTLPELVPMRSSVAGIERPSVWEHTLLALDETRTLARRRLPFADLLSDAIQRRRLHWALLLHDIAKPDTLEWTSTPNGHPRPTFHGHETEGAAKADRLLERLKHSVSFRREVSNLVRWHLRPGLLADSDSPPRGMRRLVREADTLLPTLVLHAAADALGSGAKSWQTRWKNTRRSLFKLAELYDAWSDPRRQPLLTGGDVMRITGLAGGPQIGDWLTRIADAQLAGDVETREQAERWLSEALRQRS